MLPQRASLFRRPAASLVLVVGACFPNALPAQAPLHEKIDRAIRAGTPDFDRLAAGPASDAEFLRRAYLDLAGTIPTAEQARAFLKDAAPAKRQALIDRLL